MEKVKSTYKNIQKGYRCLDCGNMMPAGRIKDVNDTYIVCGICRSENLALIEDDNLFEDTATNK